MKITKQQLRKIIKEELLKEFGSEEYGLQTKRDLNLSQKSRVSSR